MATAIEPGTREGRGGDGNTSSGPSAQARAGQAQGREYVQPDGPRAQGEGLANFLGWFSIGLGVAQVTAPGAVARLVGVEDSDRSRKVMRTAGVREIAHGLGIFSTKPRPTRAVWSRVAGDVLDLALLGKALRNDDNDRDRTAAATAAVIGVTALDVLCAQQLKRNAGTTAERAEKDSSIRTRKSITVRLPVEKVYRFWRDFENLPRFMRHLESVQVIDERRSHWKAKAPAGITVEWDAEITDERPNELIAWRSLEGADVFNAGTVRFQPAPGGRGTEVRVELQYDPPGGVVGAKLATLFRKEPGQQVQDDLRVFKQVMETGDIVLSDATVFDGPHPARPPEKPFNRPEKPVNRSEKAANRPEKSASRSEARVKR